MIRAYHGSTVKIEKFEYQLEVDKERTDQCGPGIYVTTCRDNASHYGRHIHTVDIKFLHAVPTRGKVDLKEVSLLVNRLSYDEKALVFSDWAEDPIEGYHKFRELIKGRTPYDAFTQVWYDVFYRNGWTHRYLQGMQDLGYDGVIVEGNRGVTHFVVHSGDHITLVSHELLQDTA